MKQALILRVAIGCCGLVILIIALPGWFLWALFGASLIAGALCLG